MAVWLLQPNHRYCICAVMHLASYVTEDTYVNSLSVVYSNGCSKLWLRNVMSIQLVLIFKLGSYIHRLLDILTRIVAMCQVNFNNISFFFSVVFFKIEVNSLGNLIQVLAIAFFVTLQFSRDSCLHPHL